MNTRKLGNTDLEFTVIGFGAWAIGGPWAFGWGPTDDELAVAAIKEGLDRGINWIDTAHVYGFGHSEEVVGRAIKGRDRDSVLVATKCGLLQNPAKPFEAMPKLKAASVREELEGSLRRLDVDYIDLYQIHWPNPPEDIEEAWTEMAKILEEGKVRAIGVSNFNPEQMDRVAKIHPIASLQPPYSMVARDSEFSQIPYCNKNNIGVVCYSPMHSGLLTGKVTHEWVENLADDDWRKTKNPNYQSPALDINVEFIEGVLRPIADAHGVAPGQIAVAWTLRGDLITSAIVGARNPRQVAETVRAAEVKLTEEDLQKIEEGLKTRTAKLEAAK
ncbi:aldo/keto reductase [bacterium]|nr:aldo/keto reductase [bacterium]